MNLKILIKYWKYLVSFIFGLVLGYWLLVFMVDSYDNNSVAKETEKSSSFDSNSNAVKTKKYKCIQQLKNKVA